MVDYIGYKDNTVGTTFVPIVVPLGEPISTAIATAAATAVATIVASWNDWFKHPARDANRLIDSIKPQIASNQPRERLALVLATAQKISPEARDVSAEKLFLWYKQNYPNDYQVLLPDDKIFYNNFLINGVQTQADGNNFYYNSQRAMFTNDELNFNSTPATQAVQAVNQAGQAVKSVGTANWILYGGIALALFLILKKK